MIHILLVSLANIFKTKNTFISNWYRQGPITKNHEVFLVQS